MAVKVMMPKGSDTMTEGKVLKWLKKEGDAISTGDAVVEIETDKVNMEVEAMGSGVLRKILVAVDKMVPVGELLAVIGKQILSRKSAKNLKDPREVKDIKDIM